MKYDQLHILRSCLIYRLPAFLFGEGERDTWDIDVSDHSKEKWFHFLNSSQMQIQVIIPHLDYSESFMLFHISNYCPIHRCWKPILLYHKNWLLLNNLSFFIFIFTNWSII